MQTAVEWLEGKLDNLLELYTSEWEKVNDVLGQAKEMEKQQHKETWFDSTLQFDNSAEMTNKKLFDDYFAETYGSKGSDEHHEDNLDEMPTSSQTEISDEEINKEALSYFNEHHCNVFEYDAFIAGVKWYREQLKKKQ